MSATISAGLVKDLRERTGAGMMDCKRALSESKGSMDEAIELLRKWGLQSVNKRHGKTAAEGTIGVYVHAGGQVVSIVELNCETDFVARGEEFKETARNIAMHVAAMRPQFVAVEDVPNSILEKEREILLEQLEPAQRAKADKILPGKIEKFYQDTVLLRQAYVKDDSGKKTVETVVQDLSAKVGEKVQVRRFERFEVGEGIAKAETNLAAEVAATISGS